MATQTKSKTKSSTTSKATAAKASDDAFVSRSIRLKADQWAWLQEQEGGAAEQIRALVEAARTGTLVTAPVTSDIAEVALPTVETVVEAVVEAAVEAMDEAAVEAATEAIAEAAVAAAMPTAATVHVDPTLYVPGAEFHSGSYSKVYDGNLDAAAIKRAARMAHVVYEPAHENHQEHGDRRGHGKAFATWVYSEEHGSAENLLDSGVELIMDTVLEPGAAVGVHGHYHTEEVYYLLAGALTMTTTQGGHEQTETLHPGDAHLVKPGQTHFCQAGPEGARFLTIAARV